MKTMFTRLFSIAAVATLTLGAITVKAQTTSLNADAAPLAGKTTTADQKTEVKADDKIKAEEPVTAKKEVKAADDTSFKPVRRLWGYAFGDLYYKGHGDALNRGGSNQYTGIAQNRNGFQMRRIYLGYDYDINKKFSAEVLLAAEDNETSSIINGSTSTTTGDLLADNKLTFYIKLMNLRIHDIWTGTDLVIGQVSTPAFPLVSEKIWGYRSIERTVADIRRTPSFDLGATLQGTFDPATKNFGYDVMVGNGTSAKPESDIYKWFYGDIWAKFFNKKLVFDLYADYEQLSPNTAAAPMVSRNMLKGYVAYTTPEFTFGVEAFTNKLKNGAAVTSASVISFENQTAQAISLYARGRLVQDPNTKGDLLGFFARFDTYNPDTKFDLSHGTYKGQVGNYDPNTKEQFITAGLDYQPAKNIHFMPNIWYNSYKSQNTTLTGTALKDHDVVYRATFYYTFGK